MSLTPLNFEREGDASPAVAPGRPDQSTGTPAEKWWIIIRTVVDYAVVIRRHLTEHLLQALGDTPAVLITGARQTGKSTLVQSVALTKPDRQYLTFDDPGVLAAAKHDPNGFIAGLRAAVFVVVVQSASFRGL